jgi:cation diffusion facilitator CzcD-associated flavoprotein CzcO
VTTIETDYLIIGAGASALAFADALLSEADVEVVIVDRRSRPGGHWNDAYSFVRLHQPSASYGVNSRALGNDSIDRTGPNAGFYERASGVEICDYFSQVIEH